MSQTEVTHTDSIQEEDPHLEPPKKQKSRRPASTSQLETSPSLAFSADSDLADEPS